jgi:hypothetical protein
MQTALVEGLAQRVAAGDVPDTLRDVSVVALDMGLLMAGKMCVCISCVCACVLCMCVCVCFMCMRVCICGLQLCLKRMFKMPLSLFLCSMIIRDYPQAWWMCWQVLCGLKCSPLLACQHVTVMPLTALDRLLAAKWHHTPLCVLCCVCV